MARSFSENSFSAFAARAGDGFKILRGGREVGGAAFAGRIIEVKRNLSVHIAAVGDTYRTIAAATGCKEAALRELNGAKPVYPTCKIFYPRKNN